MPMQAGDAARGARLIREALESHVEVVARWKKLRETLGIEGQPIGAKKLRELGVRPHGIVRIDSACTPSDWAKDSDGNQKRIAATFRHGSHPALTFFVQADVLRQTLIQGRCHEPARP